MAAIKSFTAQLEGFILMLRVKLGIGAQRLKQTNNAAVVAYILKIWEC